MSEQPVLLAGVQPLASQNDEPKALPENQPSDRITASEASEKSPDETNDNGAVENEQDQIGVLEKRFKDTQRAVSERDRKIEALSAQLEMLGKMVSSGGIERETNESKQQYAKRLEEIKQQSIENPGVLADYFGELMQGQHQYFTQELRRQAEAFEAKLIESDPQYAEMRDAIGALDEVGLSELPASAKAKIAGAMKKHFSGKSGDTLDAQIIRPSGSPAGGQRKGSEAKKQPSKREQYKAFLTASGALKDDTPKGIVRFTTG